MAEDCGYTFDLMQKNFLVADCGGTGCEWWLIESDQSRMVFESPGFNPSYQSAEVLAGHAAELRQKLGSQVDIERIYFYGAGCGNRVKQQIASEALKSVFVSAKVFVFSDILGAARAVYNSRPVVCGILGTGSNSCFYDGNEITSLVPSMGFILGDEGSGNHIGKELLRAFFYNDMPDYLAVEFGHRYSLTPEKVIQQLYQEDKPATYLASFARFAGDKQADGFIRNLVSECFKQYIEHHVLNYSLSGETEISFVGSVAFYFRDILEETARNRGLRISRIVEKPAKWLAAYHRNQSSM